MPNTQTYQLLSFLMTALQSNGFRVGTGQQLRLQELMEKLPDDISLENLKYRLAPIFAKSKEEQELFYELFEVAKKQIEVKPEKTLKTTISKSKNPFKKWIWLVSFLLIVALSILIYLRLNPIAAPYTDNPLPIVSETILAGDTTIMCVDNAFRANELLEDRADKTTVLQYTLCNGLSEGTHLGLGVYQVDSVGCVNYIASDTGKVQLCISMAFEFSKNVETIVDTVLIEIDIEAPAQSENEYQVPKKPITKIEKERNENTLAIRPLPINRNLEELEAPQASVWTNEYYAFETIFRNWLLSRQGLIISILLLLILNYCLIFFSYLKNWFISPKEIKKIEIQSDFQNDFKAYIKRLNNLIKKDVHAAYSQLEKDLKPTQLKRLSETKERPIDNISQSNSNIPQQQTKQRTYAINDNPFNEEGSISQQTNIEQRELTDGELEIQLAFFVDELSAQDFKAEATKKYYSFRMDYLKNGIISTLVALFMTAVMFGFLYFFHFKFGLAILFGVLLAMIVRYLNRNRKIIAEIEPSKKPPFAWNISIPDNHKVIYNENFHLALNQLRQRTEDQFYRLNVAETVQETIKHGGQIQFQYTQQTKPPEYLMLIDRRSAANHRAAMFNMLYESFKANDVIVERFYFDGDIRLVFNENNKGGILLKNLKYQFQDARLLILSDGYTLLNGRTGKLSKWTETLNNWKDKAIMTPKAPAIWGRKERQLANQFEVLPSTIQGFQTVIEAFESTEPADFSKWQSIQNTALEPIQFDGDLISTLEKYYAKDNDKRLIKWIAACAVYPTIHWDLTLSIGKLIADRTDDVGFLDLDNLLEINRLDWFVNGKIPKQVRVELIEYLEKNDAELLTTVREHIHELLQNNPPPEDSAVFEDYQMSVITNQMLMENDAKKQQELEAEFKKMVEAGAEADFTVLKYLDRKQTALDFIVPDNWKNLVYNNGQAFFGKKHWTWAIPLWIILAISLMAYSPNIPNCKGQTLEFQERELCIKNQADEVLLREFIVLNFIKNKKYEAADSMVTLMFNNVNQSFNNRMNSNSTLDMLEYNLLSFMQNVSTAYFNAGVPFYNLYQQSKGQQTVLSNLETDKNTACAFFGKAYALDSTVQIFQKMVEECLTGEEFDGFIIPKVAGKVVDASTGNELNEVKVSVVDESSIYTDKNGNYSLQLGNEPRMNLKLRFQKKYYYDLVKTFELSENLLTLETVQLESAVKTKKPINKKEPINQNIPDLPHEWDKTNDGYQVTTDGGTASPVEQKRIPVQQKPSEPEVNTERVHVPSMISVKGGSFMMGSDKDKSSDNPSHQVVVDDFSISKYEITNKEFLEFILENKNNKSKLKEWLTDRYGTSKIVMNIISKQWEVESGADNAPVVGVTWFGAAAYCQWLSNKTGKNYRLPTEAEWEYAAKSGHLSKTDYTYSGSNDLSKVGWYRENSNKFNANSVGRKAGNNLGIHDMSGNVWEWCSDWYGKNYYQTQTKGGVRNPTGEKRGTSKVARGGAFDEGAEKCTVSYRGYFVPTRQNKTCGFRVVLN